VGFLNSPCSHIHEEKSQLLIMPPHGDRLSDQECLPSIVLICDTYVQQLVDILVVFHKEVFYNLANFLTVALRPKTARAG